MGSPIALKAFAATIIGGFGGVTGAIVGGLALGVVETFGAAYISVPYKDAFAFLVLVFFWSSGRRASSANGRGESMSAPARKRRSARLAPRVGPLLCVTAYLVGAAMLVTLAATCRSTATS